MGKYVTGSLSHIHDFIESKNERCILKYHIYCIYPKSSSNNIYTAEIKKKGIFKFIVDILW